jgi:hypothetical protein
MQSTVLLMLPLLAQSSSLSMRSSLIFPKEFSAVPIASQKGSSFKLFARPMQLRVEASRGFISLVSLYDRSKPSYLTLFPGNRTYVEAKSTTIPSMSRPELARYASGTDGNPCAYKDKATCVKRQDETMNGRMATKWEATFAGGKRGIYWVDKELLVVLKAEDPSFSFELKEIRIGSQPADLFSIPPGFLPKK